MNFIPAHIIQKKRDGVELSKAEIHFFINGAVDGSIPDYQITSLLMTIFFNGMNIQETAHLTEAMLLSGEKFSFNGIEAPLIDKHSTGGVGDKVSLILAPLAAACGLAIPMMSGRGLGHSGGTLDKLSAIKGYNTHLTKDQLENQLKTLGCAIIGQSKTIAPADKKLYALRDVTATVECIPLITASILSKKLAEGCKFLVLDVKVGNGAFMKTLPKAKALAKTITLVSKKLGLPCKAVLTNMDQPLGYSAGNSLEIIESIEVLQNGTLKQSYLGEDLVSCDLKEITIQLCAQMLVMSKKVKSLAEGRKLAILKLADGSAYLKFCEMIKAQGGSIDLIKNPLLLPISENKIKINALKSGFITELNTKFIGQTIVSMGGGRKTASDDIDPSVGILFHKKLGAKIMKGQNLFTLYGPKNATADELKEFELSIQKSITIKPSRKPVPKLIYDVI